MNAGTEKQLSCRASGAKPQAKIVWYHGHNKILDQGTLSSIEYSKKLKFWSWTLVTQGIFVMTLLDNLSQKLLKKSISCLA